MPPVVLISLFKGVLFMWKTAMKLSVKLHPLVFILLLLHIATPSAQDHINWLSSDYLLKTEKKLHIQEEDFVFHSAGIVSFFNNAKGNEIISIGLANFVLIFDNNWVSDFAKQFPIATYVNSTPCVQPPSVERQFL
jgi:hypothetical protein